MLSAKTPKVPVILVVRHDVADVGLGFGREGGQHALNFYSEQKNICIKL